MYWGRKQAFQAVGNWAWEGFELPRKRVNVCDVGLKSRGSSGGDELSC